MKFWFKSYFLVMFVLFFALSSLGESLTVLNEVPISDLLKRAEAGDVDAQYNAGLRYFWGNRGVEKDNDQAARWFQKASDQGHVEAQMNMGRMMVLGWGFPNDLDGGLALLRDASEKGSGGACWVLGDLFERGERTG